MTQETTTTQTTTIQNTPAIDLNTESSVAGWEWILIGTAVLIAGIYLLRKLGGRKGGCGSCGKANACVAGCQPQEPTDKTTSD